MARLFTGSSKGEDARDGGVKCRNFGSSPTPSCLARSALMSNAISLAVLFIGLACTVCAAKRLPTLPAYALSSPVTAHALRLLPGDDLVQKILDHCESHCIGASTVLSCVGSLSEITLRLAGAEDMMTLTEELVIISLVGTVCSDREHHFHCSVSRRDGSVIGGHCKGAATVRTTAEVMLGVLPGLQFSRDMDDATGYKELQIKPAKLRRDE